LYLCILKPVLRAILICVFFFSNFFLKAQGETWNWYIGNSDGIAFIKGKYPQLSQFQKSYFFESTSSISSATGDLILYSSASSIFDKKGNVIIDTLKAHYSSSQGNLFLRHPKSSHIYFFSTPANDGPQYGTRVTQILPIKDSFAFNYCNKLVYPSTCEKMSAVNHQNNSDVWIINHSLSGDTFLLFLLKKDGLICCPVKNKIGVAYDSNSLEGAAHIKFSPSGKRILNNTWTKSKTELFEFENESGKMNLKISLTIPYSYSAEFASNENVFYVNENASKIMQYIIDKSYNYKSNLIFTDTDQLLDLQHGYDKKIYLSRLGSNLARISNPDSLGSKCNYNDSFLKLSASKTTPGLPNFNVSYFYTPSVDFQYELDCRTNTITFEGRDSFSASNHFWVFKKDSITANKTGKKVSYTFKDTGKWQVIFIAGKTGRLDTLVKTIHIRAKLKPGFLGGDIHYCTVNPFPLTLNAPKDLHCIHWYNDSLNEISHTNKVTLTKPGTYIAKATNNSFCTEWDTVVIINKEPEEAQLNVTACNSYKLGKNSYYQSGTYIDTLTSRYGCDSAIILNLTIAGDAFGDSTAFGCSIFTLNGQTYTSSGSYSQHLRSKAGCDSFFTLNLKIATSTDHNMNVKECNSYTLNGQTYKSSGVYKQTLTNKAGCDSTITLELTINQASFSTQKQTECLKYKSPSGKYTWIQSGTYTDTITNKSGCDSIITIELIINSTTYNTQRQTGCLRYRSPSGKYVWIQSGTYTDTIPNNRGCDSILTINLTVNQVNIGVIKNEPTLTANASSAIYQWLNCNNNYSTIVGETHQSFTAKVVGNYAVSITENNCTDTSDCYTISNVSVEQADPKWYINLYPNPSNKVLNLETKKEFANANIKILNSLGEDLFEIKKFNGNHLSFDVSALAKGVYKLEVIENGSYITLQFVKL